MLNSQELPSTPTLSTQTPRASRSSDLGWSQFDLADFDLTPPGKTLFGGSQGTDPSQGHTDRVSLSQETFGSPPSPMSLFSPSGPNKENLFSLTDDQPPRKGKARSKVTPRQLDMNVGTVAAAAAGNEALGFDEGDDLGDFKLTTRPRGKSRETWSTVKRDVSNLKRFDSEFDDLGVIGTGEFGVVFKCRNKIDGCLYAIKKSKRPIRGQLDEKNALKEVHAHAMLSSLGAHSNIVRYYSVWKEDDHLFIQNELCDLGSLPTLGDFNEKKLLIILKQTLEGLEFIHDKGFVHQDIKPGNMFVSSVTQPRQSKGEAEGNAGAPAFLCKIGDFGLMTTLDDPKVEEGDCRYLALEVLNGDTSNLPKADIFALGILIYELASGNPLPKNGEEWTKLRTGEIPPLEGFSKEFNAILKSMMAPNTADRPTATQLLSNPMIHQDKDKQSISQLTKELTKERLKTESLERLLKKQKGGEDEEKGPSPPKKKAKILRCQTIL